ncbi:MAG: hypothetical protein P4L92_05490 [Rudaea sp.]|nr:hypothetical protein [Rudaea sp.]
MSEMQLVNALGQLAGILILAASVVLWFRARTTWLLIAMIAQIVGMLCRVVLTLSPGMYTQMSLLHLLWPLASGVFGAALLCHALLETPTASRTPASSDLPS